MENASRALIIAGAIFIGILILSLWVYFYTNLSGSTTAVLNRNQNIEVTSFNNTLLMVNGADGKLKRGENTYMGDLITVIHYAQNQNLLAQRQVNDGEKLVQLETSLDDITGEEVGFLYEVLFSKGALEVYSTNILMKKSRPGILLTVLVEEDKKDLILREIFKHSPTIGVKEFSLKRSKLDREEVIVETSFGKVRKKLSRGFDTEKSKYEYEDLRDLSLENDLSLKDLREKIIREDLEK